MSDKQPIRKTLINLRKGASATFPIERYDVVVSTVSRLNTIASPKRWRTNIVKDNPDNDNPVGVKVTRTF